MSLALLLAAARKIPAGDAAIRAGKFQEGIPPGINLEGRTLGIVGLGRIGAYMARYGQAIGMRVIAWSPNLTAEKARAAGAERVEKEQLFAESDAVTIHMVLGPRSRGLVGAAELARMKKGAILVNTSRGPIVDEKALVAALCEGRIFAGLDVYDAEPLPPNNPFRDLPNTVLTPHLGSPQWKVWAISTAAPSTILSLTSTVSRRTSRTRRCSGMDERIPSQHQVAHEDLRDLLRDFEAMREVKRIEDADPHLEIAALAETLTIRFPGEEPALLFDKIKGFPAGFRILSGASNSFRRLGAYLRFADARKENRPGQKFSDTNDKRARTHSAEDRSHRTNSRKCPAR